MSSEEFKCVFCKETFGNKETLQVHFRKHGDKNFHINKGRTQDDQIILPDKPAGSKDQPEMVQCDVCPEMFTSISKAITHKHKVHPDHDAKYFCPWCGKLFTMKHLYNKHIQTTHPHDDIVNTTFHCDVCDVAFNRPVALAYHNKFFHRIFDMPIIGNSKKLKMVGQEAIQIYYCPFCGEEYENKINLHKHMTDDHGDENQRPEDVFRCPVCDAIFYHLDAYELHLTYHSTDDLYSERSEIMDEITDFSLEAVPPLAEKVETLDQGDSAMGIEQLFELTMDDPKMKRKKHKKHKKSKKSAITLDQFLNMNTDVFGEGLDFQGIEEVPTRVIAKHLKKPIKKPVQSKLPPDIEKLKRQGIVIKKNAGATTVQALSINKKRDVAINQNPKLGPQNPNTSNTNDVITKLMNQNNSQIKIMKMSNSEVKNTNEDTTETERVSPTYDYKLSADNKVSNGTLQSSTISEGKDPTKENNGPRPDDDTYPNNMTRKSPILENKNSCLDEDSNHSQSIIGSDGCSKPVTKKNTDITDKLCALRNNSNIVIKSSKQNITNVNITNELPLANLVDDNITDRIEDVDPEVNEESKESDSLNAIKHLNHLVVKSLTQERREEPNTNITKLDKKIQQPDISKIAHLIKNITKELAPANIEDENITDHEEDIDSDVIGGCKDTDSLNALKRLDHLLVKPLAQEKKEEVNINNSLLEQKIQQSDVSKIAHLIRNSPAKLTTNPVKVQVAQQLITPSIKTREIDSEENHFTNDEFDEPDDTSDTEPIQVNKLASILNNPHLNIHTISQVKKPLKVEVQKESPEESSLKSEKSSADLLKHLKNVTAKPVAINKTVNISQPPRLSPKLVNTIKKEPVSPPIKHSKVIQEDIEIFNIDDSDSDEANNDSKKAVNTEKIESPGHNKSMAVLKNINKNVTIKSLNSHITNKADKTQYEEFGSQGNDDGGDEEIHPYPNNSKNHIIPNSPQMSQKQSALNNVLKNLSKNITVKSGNLSPGYFPDQDLQDIYAQGDDSESDTDTIPGRVKITEMDNAVDDGESPDATEHASQGNVQVQYPDDSNSDDEEGKHPEQFDQNFSEDDIESHININTVKKNNNHSTPHPKLDNLKNVCKELVIRPSGPSMNKPSQNISNSDEIPLFAKSLSNQISIKNLQQGNSSKQVKLNTINSKNTELTSVRSMNKSSINQKVVNKEVKTVKTFQTKTQTKTVIQEVTTTVTKTIKTVNQSSKQEVKLKAPTNSTPRKFPQVTGNNSNFQSIKVRQAAPMPGPRIRNPSMRPTRPALPPPIRASNQLVPVRPRFSTPRQMNPRLPIRPSTSGLQGAQLKIASGASAPNATKRTNLEVPGHFSCFKKPKESLFAEADFTAINKHEGDSAVQFSSSMQMSKSNFACTTKIVKGNSVVTSTQMNSEMSASSQQLGKLRNLSGLSIVKTSQANQSHVEETSEISAKQQNTLDAIQRLQSQGLLLKKPRLARDENQQLNQSREGMEHSSEEDS